MSVDINTLNTLPIDVFAVEKARKKKIIFSISSFLD